MPYKTIPAHVFHVQDAGGRRYKVTRYAWLENLAAEGQPEKWNEFWHLLLTENGGIVDPVEDDERHFVIDGTGTEVALVEGETAGQPVVAA
ncbi:hypothetical protein [Hydrogenophaga sp.]|uniref:hypothetical protein n=1 Tax=Hydrogenophaga sp. TaxID=1904254 RepID=UPI00260171F8|nr:hypothetical protein [Hydrogenophaga sp.]MCW5653191.1 hypothetical protein [Hydrogenophaga sp.]